MTRALLLSVWIAFVFTLTYWAYWIGQLRKETRRARRRRDLDDAVDQALRLTQVPPEDREDWGTR